MRFGEDWREALVLAAAGLVAIISVRLLLGLLKVVQIEY